MSTDCYQTVLEALGYPQSRHFFDLANDSPSDNRVYQQAREAGTSGVYVFLQSRLQNHPAILLVRAKSVEEVRLIRKRLWNQGKSPFMMFVLPDQIRVYSGFRRPTDDETLLTLNNPSLDLIAQQLSSFSAAAIDSGQLWQSHSTGQDHISVNLLENLKKLARVLCKKGLSASVSNKLIGKCIFLRYLMDRSIITPSSLAMHGIDLDLAAKSVAEMVELFTYLNVQFNGSIFPVDFHAEGIHDDHIDFVMNTLMGGVWQEGGGFQSSLFSLYDFKYIPIETLSVIYEHFTVSEDSFATKNKGVVYTAEFLVEFALDQMEEYYPLQPGFKVLDPACGSGVFLVCAFRRMISKLPLVDRHSPERLKALLCQSIFGVERESGACMVAEFSLILTMLDYLAPEDLVASAFRLPCLRGRTLIQADFFDSATELEKFGNFDWIIGNPPWTSLKGNRDQDSFRVWLESNKDKPVGDTRISEGFIWAAPALLNERGLAGLLIHAKTLTNKKSRKFRKAFFSAFRLASVSNFANMRRTLFGTRTITPAALLMFWKELPVGDDLFTHYGPMSANQPCRPKHRHAWAITISTNEIQNLPQRLAMTGSAAVWKAALWGHAESHLQNLRTIRHFAETDLETLCQDRQWKLAEGPQFREVSEGRKLFVAAVAQGRMPFLKKLGKNLTHLNPEDIGIIETSKPWLRRGDAQLHPCQIALHPSWNWQIYSELQFLMAPRQFFLGGTENAHNELRALALYLCSSIPRYFLLFHSADWGFERDRINLENVKAIPVPYMTKAQIEHLANDHRSYLEQEKQNGPMDQKTLRRYADASCQRIFRFPGRLWQEAGAFFDLNFTLNEGVIKTLATQPTDSDFLSTYALRLRDDLDDFLKRADLHHLVKMIGSPDAVWCQLTLESSNHPLPPEISFVSKSFFEMDLLVQRESQWRYVQRNLKVFDHDRVQLLKPNRRIDWSIIQAGVDSGDILADFLGGT